MTASPAFGNFTRAADELQRQGFARLVATVTSMTQGSFADELASMMERLGHIR